jgi:hypothetical protein
MAFIESSFKCRVVGDEENLMIVESPVCYQAFKSVREVFGLPAVGRLLPPF